MRLGLGRGAPGSGASSNRSSSGTRWALYQNACGPAGWMEELGWHSGVGSGIWRAQARGAAAAQAKLACNTTHAPSGARRARAVFEALASATAAGPTAEEQSSKAACTHHVRLHTQRCWHSGLHTAAGSLARAARCDRAGGPGEAIHNGSARWVTPGAQHMAVDQSAGRSVSQMPVRIPRSAGPLTCSGTGCVPPWYHRAS